MCFTYEDPIILDSWTHLKQNFGFRLICIGLTVLEGILEILAAEDEGYAEHILKEQP